MRYTTYMNPNVGDQDFQYRQEPSVGGSGQESFASEPPQPQTPQPAEPSLVQWQASEFIDHQKSAGWFLPLIGVSIVLCGIMYLITRDILSTVVVFLACAAFGFYAQQKPRTLTYTLLPTSFKIGQRSYSYDDFRTFSIVQDGPLYSIFLQPLKRLMPPLTIYFDPQDGERIFDILASHIPHEERVQDPIDRFMRRIRF